MTKHEAQPFASQQLLHVDERFNCPRPRFHLSHMGIKPSYDFIHAFLSEEVLPSVYIYICIYIYIHIYSALIGNNLSI